MLKQRGRSCGRLVDKSLSAEARQPSALGYKQRRAGAAIAPVRLLLADNSSHEIVGARPGRCRGEARVWPRRS
jgi:hypothetical protein